MSDRHPRHFPESRKQLPARIAAEKKWKTQLAGKLFPAFKMKNFEGIATCTPPKQQR